MKLERTTVGATLNRVMSRAFNEDKFVLALEDEPSGTRFIEITFTGQQLAEMLTGMFQSKIPAEYRGLDLIGKRAESRAVNIFTYANKNKNPDWKVEVEFDFQHQYPQLYEEGWRLGYYGWVQNHHYSIGSNAEGVPGYSAMIVRHVPIEGTHDA